MPPSDSEFLAGQVAGPVEHVWLEQSYHVATIDHDGPEVARRIVEFGPSEHIYAHPKEAYTQRLISATPKDDLESIRHRQAQRHPASSGSEIGTHSETEVDGSRQARTDLE